MSLAIFPQKDLEDLIQKSRTSPRKRAIHIFHSDDYPGPQVGINVIQPESYIRPHFRYDDESIMWYSGRFGSLTFDPEGKISGKREISKKQPYLWLPKETFHTLISLEPDSAIWFVVQGPHSPNRFSEYLPSAPPENENYGEYFEWLKHIV